MTPSRSKVGVASLLKILLLFCCIVIGNTGLVTSSTNILFVEKRTVCIHMFYIILGRDWKTGRLSMLVLLLLENIMNWDLSGLNLTLVENLNNVLFKGSGTAVSGINYLLCGLVFFQHIVEKNLIYKPSIY